MTLTAMTSGTLAMTSCQSAAQWVPLSIPAFCLRPLADVGNLREVSLKGGFCLAAAVARRWSTDSCFAYSFVFCGWCTWNVVWTIASFLHCPPLCPSPTEVNPRHHSLPNARKGKTCEEIPCPMHGGEKHAKNIPCPMQGRKNMPHCMRTKANLSWVALTNAQLCLSKTTCRTKHI